MSLLAEAIAPLARAPGLVVLLDYDGTLVPLARRPEMAAPDGELLDLLAALAARRLTDVHIVSGRPRDILERWFGHLPIALWAEHGFFRRGPGRGPWVPAAPIPADWMERVRPILERFTAATPGSFIEPKDSSVAWHFRESGDAGDRHARDLLAALAAILEREPLEVLEGKKIVEVRQRGYDKGLVARQVALASRPAAILAVGDDQTDEDLFTALPGDSVTVAVGTRLSAAKYHAADPAAVRLMLRGLI